jgi:hypothetical protein
MVARGGGGWASPARSGQFGATSKTTQDNTRAHLMRFITAHNMPKQPAERKWITRGKTWGWASEEFCHGRRRAIRYEAGRRRDYGWLAAKRRKGLERTVLCASHIGDRGMGYTNKAGRAVPSAPCLPTYPSALAVRLFAARFLSSILRRFL